VADLVAVSAIRFKDITELQACQVCNEGGSRLQNDIH